MKKHREKIESKVRKSVSELRELPPVINEVEENKSDVSDVNDNDPIVPDLALQHE